MDRILRVAFSLAGGSYTLAAAAGAFALLGQDATLGGPPAINLSGTAWTPNRDGSGAVRTTDFPQLPANSWVTVAGSLSKLTDVQPLPIRTAPASSDGFLDVVRSWSGAAWDGALKRMHIIGGGHTGAPSTENEVLTVDATTMQVSLTVDRDAASAAAQWNGSALVAGDGFPAGVNYPTQTGRWGTQHTYYSALHISAALGASLGLGTSAAGWLYCPGTARQLVNLTTGATTKIWWKRSSPDNSNMMSVLWGNRIIRPYNSFSFERWDMSQTETTDWAATSFDPNPAVPSFGAAVAVRTASQQFVYNNRAFIDMPELGRMFSLSATPLRVNYGAAEDANASDWSSHCAAITLTGAGATDLNTGSNYTETAYGLLYGAGASYLHATGEVFVCPNTVGNEVYRITGLDTGTTGTVTKLTGSGVLTNSQNGTFGRFRVFQHAGCTLAMRISAVGNPIEVMRIV